MQKLDGLIGNILKNSGTQVIFVRNAQSMGNHAGSLVGWTDSRLSIKGRQQSNQLYQGFFRHIGSFKTISCSTLSRSVMMSELALGFPSRTIQKDNRLREINFGDDEGKHFDSLPDKDKQRINSFDYRAPNGQSWNDVKTRALDYFKYLDVGTHLAFSHGGLICTQTFSLGITDVISNASVVALSLDGGIPKKLLFDWRFPTEQAEKPI